MEVTHVSYKRFPSVAGLLNLYLVIDGKCTLKVENNCYTENTFYMKQAVYTIYTYKCFIALSPKNIRVHQLFSFLYDFCDHCTFMSFLNLIQGVPLTSCRSFLHFLEGLSSAVEISQAYPGVIKEIYCNYSPFYNSLPVCTEH